MDDTPFMALSIEAEKRPTYPIIDLLTTDMTYGKARGSLHLGSVVESHRSARVATSQSTSISLVKAQALPGLEMCNTGSL
jgi:hypothetical protein